MKRFPQLSILAIVVLAAALLGTGCGGGGGGDAPLTKAEFIKQGNAVCRKAFHKRTEDYGAYVRKHHESLFTEEIATKFFFPSMLEMAEELNGLAAPRGDEKKVEAILVAIEEAVKKAEKSVEKEPENFEVPFDGAAELARKYGMVACAEVL